MSQIIRITNLNIMEKTDKNGNFYYLLFDNEEVNGVKKDINLYCLFLTSDFAKNRNEAHYETFSRNWQNIKEIEVQYETTAKGNRVTDILDIIDNSSFAF